MKFLPIFVIAALMSGCVSKTAYDEMAESRNYHKQEARAADSLRLVNNQLYERNRNLTAELNKAERELNMASVTNNALRRNYDEILAKYNSMVGSSQDLLAVSAYEKQNLNEDLAAKQAELDRKQREAVAMEYALQAREDRLEVVESYETFGSGGGAASAGSQELNALLENQRQQMTQLQQSLGRALAPYGAASSQITLQDNRLTLSLQHSLLFTEGGFQLGAQGIQALNQVAAVLASYSNVEVLVVGRGDSYGASDTNWEYGIQRATSVARSLATAGVNPSRILASGQGPGYSSAFGIRPVLNQTDIILMPNMDRVYQLLSR